MRKAYQRRLPSDTSKDYYFIHRDTGRTQPIIVEYGFLDNSDDADQLKNNWEELVEAVVGAIAQYAGYNYLPITGNFYTVQKGDSLWSIAKKYNITVDELKSLNNLTSNLLSVGQRLKIPGTTETVTDTYTVKSGDSLYSIAREYNTTVSELMNLNNLTSSTLSIGQVLKLPVVEDITENVDYIDYTVKPGDSLYGIATKYGITVDELKNFNNLSNNILSIGQNLKIPVAIEEDIINENYITYTVQPGDNLYAIARRYDTTQQEIMNLNNLTSNLLSIGQILRIPSNNITYTVKAGDNLYSIAREYNTTVSDILNKNNLSSTNLSVGQVLKI